jgi:trehalose 6-phosphate synthase/phosphatase
MEKVESLKNKFIAKNISADIETCILNNYKHSSKRILFLDYDGTLVGFQSHPDMATPDEELYSILDKLARDKKNDIVLISGRDKNTFTSWFKGKKYSLVAEHGVWSKLPDSGWKLIEQLNTEWKEIIRPVIEFYVDRTPGSFTEEKEYSLVWHYRKSDPELGILRANELKDELTSLTVNYNVDILEGNKVLEVKNSGINKGKAAVNKLTVNNYDFILGIGDDWTDEYLFEELPDTAITVKVGMSNTLAKYNVKSFNEVRELLNKLVKRN